MENLKTLWKPDDQNFFFIKGQNKAKNKVKIKTLVFFNMFVSFILNWTTLFLLDSWLCLFGRSDS